MKLGYSSVNSQQQQQDKNTYLIIDYHKTQNINQRN